MAYEKRDSFTERLAKMDEQTQSYFEQLNAKLVSFKKVKARASLRCVSYRKGRKLLAKMALGGKTLKLYLAVDASDEMFNEGKFHQRDLSDTKAYEEVPALLLIRSQLAVRKACQAIDAMMEK